MGNGLCPHCGKPLEHEQEKVWFRDGWGWRHEACSRASLEAALGAATSLAVSDPAEAGDGQG